MASEYRSGDFLTATQTQDAGAVSKASQTTPTDAAEPSHDETEGFMHTSPPVAENPHTLSNNPSLRNPFPHFQRIIGFLLSYPTNTAIALLNGRHFTTLELTGLRTSPIGAPANQSAFFCCPSRTTPLYSPNHPKSRRSTSVILSRSHSPPSGFGTTTPTETLTRHVRVRSLSHSGCGAAQQGKVFSDHFREGIILGRCVRLSPPSSQSSQRAFIFSTSTPMHGFVRARYPSTRPANERKEPLCDDPVRGADWLARTVGTPCAMFGYGPTVQLAHEFPKFPIAPQYSWEPNSSLSL